MQLLKLKVLSCASNGINLIINAGDFFDDMGGRKVDYSSAVKNYKLIDESIESIPSAPGIYHAIPHPPLMYQLEECYHSFHLMHKTMAYHLLCIFGL